MRGHNSYFRYQFIVSLVLLRGHNSYHAYWGYVLGIFYNFCLSHHLDEQQLRTKDAYNPEWYINILNNGSWKDLINWKDQNRFEGSAGQDLTGYHKINMSMHSIGLLFNILTLIVIRRFKVISRSYKLMAVLALADIGSCLSSFINIFKLSRYTPKYGQWFKVCLFHTIYLESMIGFGAYVYLMLTIDRFVAIVKAMKYRSIMTKMKYRIYTASLLTHHVLVYFLSYMFKFSNDNQWAKGKLLTRGCNSENIIHPIAKYYIITFVTLVVLVNIVLCIALVIYLIIKQHRRKSLTGDNSRSSNISKATNTLIIVSALYAILYIQLLVITFLSSSNASAVEMKLRDISNHIFTVNNFINPLIYYLRMPEFRREFHGLFRCQTCY